MQTITYAPTNADFANPERGFYTQFLPEWDVVQSYPPLEVEQLEVLRENENVSIVNKVYFLADHRTSDLPPELLGELEADLIAAREAGMKLVPEFTYVHNRAINDEDAPLEWTLRHIEQLEPILREHAAVINHLENAFIGIWGEMHTSSNGHFRIEGEGTEQVRQFTDSGLAIIQALLDALPEDKSISVRYPGQLEQLVGENGVLNETDRGRVGMFNDGALFDETDYNTFSRDPARREVERDFVLEATEFAPVAVEIPIETGDEPAFRDDAFEYLDLLNARSVNNSWPQGERSGLYDSWRESGQYETISKGLGYRFELEEARVASEAAAGERLDLEVVIENVGFARAHGERPVDIVLRSADGTLTTIDTAVDAQSWDDGETTRVDLSVDLPETLAPGDYEVLLSLPDRSDALADDPRYAIRLANEGVWEAETGLNALGASVTVTAADEGAGQPLLDPLRLDATDAGPLAYGPDGTLGYANGEGVEPIAAGDVLSFTDGSLGTVQLLEDVFRIDVVEDGVAKGLFLADLDDNEVWDTYRLLYDDAGRPARETVVDDDGHVYTATFREGVIQSARTTDPLDLAEWNAFTDTFNAAGNAVAREFVYDDGSVGTVAFDAVQDDPLLV